jgi:predicted ester cyclase
LLSRLKGHQAMRETNKALVERVVAEAMNRGQLAILDAICRPAVAAKLGQAFWEFRTAFPDWHEAIVALVGEGDRVVGHFRCSGTQRGTFGDHAPTGQRMAGWTEVFFFQIRDQIREARMTDVWWIADTATPRHRDTATPRGAASRWRSAGSAAGRGDPGLRSRVPPGSAAVSVVVPQFGSPGVIRTPAHGLGMRAHPSRGVQGSPATREIGGHLPYKYAINTPASADVQPLGISLDINGLRAFLENLLNR